MIYVYDILLDEDGDLQEKDGDLGVGESTLQHQEDILIAHKGEYRQSPGTGVGLVNYVLDEISNDELAHEIQSQLELDGMKVVEIKGENVTAYYE